LSYNVLRSNTLDSKGEKIVGDEIRIGVIGVGLIGKSHLKKYAEVPGAKVVAVSDLNIDEAQRVAAEYKIPVAYKNFQELLAQADIDAVDVCLHNNLHAPIGIAAMNADKHVYCEKPMAGSFADSFAMYDASQRTGKKLHIQIGTLYTHEHRNALRLIEAGALGKIHYARSFGFRRRGRAYVDGYGTPPFTQKAQAGGGALFDMGVYHIAEILHLLNNPTVETISGATHQELPMYEERAKHSRYDVEELGLGFVRLAGGITLSIEESWAMHYDDTESSKILGSLGGIKLNPFTFFTTVADVELNCAADPVWLSGYRRNQCYPEHLANEHSQSHWIAALQGKTALWNTAGVALNTSLISEGIYQSQTLKKELTAQEVREISKSTALKI